ncbi:MAG: bifunctional lysylphosphatidylglycerol flippase/synthetase MprF, partial [Candidatus Saccharimonadales bacterium]
DLEKVRLALARYSNSTEDYFKLWPTDKNYYWDTIGKGFIAYKVIGSVAFALADPVTVPEKRRLMIQEFVDWCRSNSLRACFIPVTQISLDKYEGLNKLDIGSSAVIDVHQFVSATSNNKWWRWKRNRATKQGYQYAKSAAPHDPIFLQALKAISDEWLDTGGHQERGFALGYFDEDYLNQCDIHYLKDEAGKIVAFTNQLPTFKNANTQTIDLLRYLPEAKDSMPFLIYSLIQQLDSEGCKSFDLGLVPFASSKNPLVSVAKILSAGRFSAKGLEQFKNKFEPDWQPNYICYDGDLGDLALITLNLEKALNLD